jgi:carboxypeptidase C (cathepsin A)
LPTGKATKAPGQLHYWLIESEKDPTTDPLVLWLNGGPGSSSLIGLLEENSPITLNDKSLQNKTKGIPQVFHNPYAWTQEANMLWLESPKGVGFSYCDDQPCINNDTTTAIDAHEFLVNFIDAYPEFSNSDFYITGESYAGVYIPMLIDEIDKQVNMRTQFLHPNFPPFPPS